MWASRVALWTWNLISKYIVELNNTFNFLLSSWSLKYLHFRTFISLILLFTCFLFLLFKVVRFFVLIPLCVGGLETVFKLIKYFDTLSSISALSSHQKDFNLSIPLCPST